MLQIILSLIGLSVCLISYALPVGKFWWWIFPSSFRETSVGSSAIRRPQKAMGKRPEDMKGLAGLDVKVSFTMKLHRQHTARRANVFSNYSNSTQFS